MFVLILFQSYQTLLFLYLIENIYILLITIFFVKVFRSETELRLLAESIEKKTCIKYIPKTVPKSW